MKSTWGGMNEFWRWVLILTSLAVLQRPTLQVGLGWHTAVVPNTWERKGEIKLPVVHMSVEAEGNSPGAVWRRLLEENILTTSPPKPSSKETEDRWRQGHQLSTYEVFLQGYRRNRQWDYHPAISSQNFCFSSYLVSLWSCCSLILWLKDRLDSPGLSEEFSRIISILSRSSEH